MALEHLERTLAQLSSQPHIPRGAYSEGVLSPCYCLTGALAWAHCGPGESPEEHSDGYRLLLLDRAEEDIVALAAHLPSGASFSEDADTSMKLWSLQTFNDMRSQVEVISLVERTIETQRGQPA